MLMKIFDFGSINLKRILAGVAVIATIFITLFCIEKIHLYNVLIAMVFIYLTIEWVKIDS